MGQTLAEDAVVPALRTYVAKKAKEESEIINARHKARELKGLGNTRPQDDGVTDGDAMLGPGRKAKAGRTRTRKQTPAAPAAGDA